MGRKSVLDKEKVSQVFLETFWENGADATSTRMLQDASGLNAGSLYYAFGSLEEMFIHAVKYYNDTVVKLRVQKHLKNCSPDIEKFLWTAVSPLVSDPKKTCFHIHSSASRIGQARGAKAAVKKGFDQIIEGFTFAFCTHGFKKSHAQFKAESLFIFYEGLLSSSLVLNNKSFIKKNIDREVSFILERCEK